jgi:Zinc carboxypeptidase
MPLVNPDGWAHDTRTGADGTDLNRNYPFGWGPSAQRGPGPGSEPEVRDTMAIARSHQVVDLVSTHTGERAILYPPLDRRAGPTPELRTGYRALARSLGGDMEVGDSAHDYETSGETIDWAYYATRAFALTFELAGQAARDAFWQALAWASLPAGHSVITGTAVAGATLRISKDFDLYTATSPPRTVPTHLESSLVVPASGRFRWDVNPSVRATPAFRAGGEVTGPHGFLDERWTLTCTAPDGARLGTEHVTVDRGQVADVSPCRPHRAAWIEPTTPVAIASGR